MIAPTNPSKFISVGKACRLYGLSAPTLRRMVDEDPALVWRTAGQHRRINRGLLEEKLGYTSNTTDTPLGLVCRVSGSNQARKSSPGAECSSLEHQQKRVEDFARERFGDEAVANASLYYRVGGGLNHEHPVLVQLISDILHGKFKGGYIVCQDSIRLMRFGNAIFDQICAFGQCEIVYVMEVDRTEAETDLSESVLSILCHFTAKASGARAKKILEIHVDEKDLVRIYRQYVNGGSYATLSKWCKHQGIKGIKGNTPVDLSPSKLHQVLSRNIEVLRQLVPDVENDTDTFIKNHLTQGDGVVKQVDLYETYVAWCNAHNKGRISAKKLGVALSKHFKSGRAMGGMKVWYVEMI